MMALALSLPVPACLLGSEALAPAPLPHSLGLEMEPMTVDRIASAAHAAPRRKVRWADLTDEEEEEEEEVAPAGGPPDVQAGNREAEAAAAWRGDAAADERTAAPLVCHPSLGSAQHAAGTCKPCTWYWKPGGCQNGPDCRHCHLCPPGEIASRRRRALGPRRGAAARRSGGAGAA
jgi:hypothetical protein